MDLLIQLKESNPNTYVLSKLNYFLLLLKDD